MKRKIWKWFFEAIALCLACLLLWWSVVAFICVVAVGIIGFIGFILCVDTIGEWLHRKK
ncbi:MAG: hypothetical protein IJV69_03890 [Kiritimatiellae bacterium]|nr:hypothetical protein [Kiritimatiellia bacterium]